ncbi:unnamed protein product [Lathyrus sativus]|nr:unnamed protein product [Lathyrus sativus]
MSGDMFEFVIHHEGGFGEFNRHSYNGLKEIWQVGPDYWSYFEILRGLKDLGYPKVESLWYYDAMDDNELVILQDDARTNRVKTIALINGNVHLYVMHPVYGEKQILPLENNTGPNVENNVGPNIENNVGPTVLEDDSLEDDMLDELNNGVKGIFDDLGTIEELNNIGDNFEEGGSTRF